MTETVVTLVGNVATSVEFKESPTGGVARFRFAVPVRRWDRARADWTDGPTSFYTVWAWRTLAANLAASVSVGEPLVVQGRLRVREEDREGRRRTFVDIEAAAAGHDLARGTSAFRRVRGPARGTPHQGQAVADLLARAGSGQGAERDPWAVPAEDRMRQSAEAAAWGGAGAGSGGGSGAAAAWGTDPVTGWATGPEADRGTAQGAVVDSGQRGSGQPESGQPESGQPKPAHSKPGRPKRSRSKPDQAVDHVVEEGREASPQPV